MNIICNRPPADYSLTGFGGWLLCLALIVLGTQVSSGQKNAAEDQPVFDLVLKGGVIYDGTGTEPYTADVGITGDRIVALGDLSGAAARQVEVVNGLAIVPGFIDMHSHASGVTPEASTIFRMPAAENLIRQGVTTIIGGQDGRSAVPVGPFLGALEAQDTAVNFGILAGHGSIRYLVMRNAERAPTESEMERMGAMLHRAMEEGAFGLSTGLEYVPGTFSDTDELVYFARILATHDGLHLTHIRNERDDVVEAVREAVFVAEAAGTRTQITHHGVHGRANRGRSTKTLALIDSALNRGVAISMDQFPYTHVSGSSSFFFPEALVESSSASLQELLSNPDSRRVLAEHVRRELIYGVGGADPSQVVITNIPWNRSVRGKTLTQVLADRGMHAGTDAVVDLLIELQTGGGFHAFLPVLAEEDVRRILSHPKTAVATDAGITAFGNGWPHPASYGTFPRVIGHYARDAGIIQMADAIRKMTGLPARVLALADRGTIREGAYADLVAIDPARVADRSTYSDPHHYPDGIVHVLVNGTFVLHKGEMTGKRPGRVLRKTMN